MDTRAEEMEKYIMSAKTKCRCKVGRDRAAQKYISYHEMYYDLLVAELGKAYKKLGIDWEESTAWERLEVLKLAKENPNLTGTNYEEWAEWIKTTADVMDVSQSLSGAAGGGGGGGAAAGAEEGEEKAGEEKEEEEEEQEQEEESGGGGNKGNEVEEGA